VSKVKSPMNYSDVAWAHTVIFPKCLHFYWFSSATHSPEFAGGVCDDVVIAVHHLTRGLHLWVVK